MTSSFTVVLTGGIASGKTTVSNLFEQKGVPVIDTDVVARELVVPGQPTLEKIVEQFGHQILLPDGNLNRQAMRDLIFSESAAKSRLEAILHPAIEKTVNSRIALTDASYCILVIPLFAESGSYRWANRVLVVDIPESLQIKRLVSRDNISVKQAETIIKSQARREDRLALADDVILNSGHPDILNQLVDKLHKRYLELTTSSSMTEKCQEPEL